MRFAVTMERLRLQQQVANLRLAWAEQIDCKQSLLQAPLLHVELPCYHPRSCTSWDDLSWIAEISYGQRTTLTVDVNIILVLCSQNHNHNCLFPAEALISEMLYLPMLIESAAQLLAGKP